MRRPRRYSDRTAGLMFVYDSDDDLTNLVLNYQESNHKIFVNTSAVNGIQFSGTVKNGKDGKHHDTSSGGNGDAGQRGRDLDLTLGDQARIEGGTGAANASGIRFDSPGGSGGEGGGSDCCSGGHGGDGGEGGFVSIVGSGSIAMQGADSVGVMISSSGGLGENGDRPEWH